MVTLMLLFKKKFLDAIRRGEKIQTIRLWKHRRMKSGQRSYIPGAGYIHVESVEPVDLDSLTAEDARRDGFASVGELRAEIDRLYADMPTDSHRPYRIVFRLLPPEEQERCAAERREAKRNDRDQTQSDLF